MNETWVERLTEEYNVSKKQLEDYRNALERGAVDSDSDWTELGEGKDEFSVVGGMISDLNYSMDWLKRGRRPGNRRGVERQSIYQRTALLDTNLFPSLDIEPNRDKPLDDKDKRAMVDILWTLSNRERQCYVLHMSYGMSFTEIGHDLSLSRSTVQTFITRAKEKIKTRT
ncbi:prophage LambdaBa01, positive control factor Xpf [Bacillus sp. JCM 19046]|nr:prophage LambdaBa01, positive control factor Xpf [Bacillus sp. JCM 19045]GAF18915.1 prophage LambdaBa01, positive control factor Xpf [Bacillus sp. JCM 19046]